MKHKLYFILFALFMFHFECDLFGQPSLQANAVAVAFPGAEGGGALASGGRGGEVLVVSNLNDDGPGSLRHAINQQGKRIIVFRVDGTIQLASPLRIRNGNVTIAGQSAPGEGICIRDFPVILQADNIIVRYVRFRMGDETKQEADALGGRQLRKIMIDHCSISWSTDECASFYANHDFTMQWCIISESLNESVHGKGRHGYGGIWGGVNTTFHHNLMAHHYSRNPRLSGSKYDYDIPNRQLDLRNNVIYNWGGNSIYGNEEGEVNIINNYFKPGPATNEDVRDRIVNPSKPYGKYFVTGNVVEGAAKISESNWLGGVQCDDVDGVKQQIYFEASPVVTQTAAKAYELVLDFAGASLHRDLVDERVVQETRAGTAQFAGSVSGRRGLIDSQEDVGGWPVLQKGTMSKDMDEDGIPDSWEQLNGLDPTNPEDASARTLHSDYDNIEVYLNSLVEKITKGQADVFDMVVATDGSGDFKTVQEAINAVPDMRRKETRIFIKNGIYKEKLILPASKTNVTFIGEEVTKTILTFDDHAKTLNAFGETIGTSGSTSFFIYGDGFSAKHITFENSAGPVGQAVAVRIDGDRVYFENCRFLGYQDTLYPHGDRSRQYYKNCYIEGTTDFIFGWSTAVFEDCEVFSKKGGHYITAASTQSDSKHGFVFINCRLTGDAPAQSVYLGRPWRDHAQTVFIQCNMGEHIKSEGWHNWGKAHAESTTFYAEYQSQGPGADPDARVKWSHQLATDQVEAHYSLEDVLGDWVDERIEKINAIK